MQFITNVADFKAALLKAKTTISQKDAQPVLRNFCLRLQGNTLTILATDLDLATVCQLEVQGSLDGSITIPGEKLFNIVSNSSAVEISLEVEENRCVLTSGTYTATLHCLAADEFPEIASFEESSPLSMKREEFLQILNRISFSISDNEARRNLLAVYINKGFIQASDGHVSSVITFNGDVDNTLIPALAVPDLVRVLRNSTAENVEVASTDSFLMFRLDKDVFVARLSQAKFPDIINKVLKPTEKNPIKISIDKKALVSALNRVSITSNKSSMAVNFHIEDGLLTLVSGDVEGNSSKEELPAESTETVDFILNYEYVQDICKSIDSEKFHIALHSNMKVPLRIEDGNFISLLMRLTPQVSNDSDSL